MQVMNGKWRDLLKMNFLIQKRMVIILPFQIFIFIKNHVVINFIDLRCDKKWKRAGIIDEEYLVRQNGL